MEEIDFEKIVRETKQIVLSAIQKHLSSDYYEAIDDVVQETYTRAYKALVKSQFKNESKLSTYLYVIARNEAFRMNQKLDKERIKVKKMEKNLAFQKDRTEVVSDNDSILQKIKHVLSFLPNKYKEVLELYFAGSTEEEISQNLKIKKGTVKSRAFRARELFRKYWEK